MTFTLSACDMFDSSYKIDEPYEVGITCPYGQEEYQGLCYATCTEDEHGYYQGCAPNQTQIEFFQQRDTIILSNDLTYNSNSNIPQLDYSADDREANYHIRLDPNSEVHFPDQSFEFLIRETLVLGELFGFDNQIYDSSYIQGKLEEIELSNEDYLQQVNGVIITHNELKKIIILPGMNRDIKSIEGIELLSNIKSINLSHNPYLTSINGVQNLSYLETININYTAVKNITYHYKNLSNLRATNTLVELNSEGLYTLISKVGYSGKAGSIYLNGSPYVKIDSINEFKIHSDLNVQVSLDYGQVHLDLISSNDIVYESQTIELDTGFIQFTDSDFDMNANYNIQSDFEEMYTYHNIRIGDLEGLSSSQKFILIYDYFYQTYKDNIREPHEFDNFSQLFNYEAPMTERDIKELICLFSLRNGIGCSLVSLTHNVYEADSIITAERTFLTNLTENRVSVLAVKFDTGENYLVDLDYALNQYALNNNE